MAHVPSKWLQTVEVIDPRQRDRRLPELLKQYHGAKRKDRIIVFVL
jgi:ATP-dependent RNA helicase DBP3